MLHHFQLRSGQHAIEGLDRCEGATDFACTDMLHHVSGQDNFHLRLLDRKFERFGRPPLRDIEILSFRITHRRMQSDLERGRYRREDAQPQKPPTANVHVRKILHSQSFDRASQ